MDSWVRKIHWRRDRLPTTVFLGFPHGSVCKESTYNVGDPAVWEILQCGRAGFDSWVGKTHWRRHRLPTTVFLGFPGGSAGKESTCNVGDLGSIPGLGRSPGEGKGYPLQYSGLKNSMDCTVHGVAKSRTPLTFIFTHRTGNSTCKGPQGTALP